MLRFLTAFTFLWAFFDKAFGWRRASPKGPVVSVRADDGEGAPRESGEVVAGQQGSPEDSADVLGFAFETAALRAALAPWRERYPDVKVLEDVQSGSAGQVLVEASPQARLMVVGRRARRSPIGTRIGSAAHAVLLHARCPVAVVPHA